MAINTEDALRAFPYAKSVHENSVAHLAVVWVVMVPLIYFADAGAFWFQLGSVNSQLVGSYSVLAGKSIGLEGIATAGGVFALCFALCFRYFPAIISALLQDRLFGAIALLAIGSVAWSDLPAKTLQWSVCLAVDTVFVFYLAHRFKQEQLIRIVLMLGWICLLLSFIMILFFPSMGISYLGGVGAWQGMYFHKNFCALSTVFFMSAAFYAPAPGSWQKGGRAAYIALSMFLVVMTQSRTGWLLLFALFAFAGASMVLRQFRSRERFPLIVILVLAGTVFFAFVLTNLSALLYSVGKDPTLTGRTSIWQAVFEAIMKRPILGYGYMAFWRGFEGESATISLANGWAVTSSHDGFLEVWLALGVVGLALVIATFVRGIRDATVCFLRGASPYVEWQACVVFLTLVTAIVEVQMLIPNNFMWMLYILACVGLANAREQQRNSPLISAL